MTPIRVLHLLGRLDLGGAELRLVELIERLPPGEFQVDVGVLSGQPGHLDARVRACGGEVIPLPLGAACLPRLFRLLRARRYPVVHSHVLYASGPLLGVALAAGVPIRVAHFHSMRDGHPATLRRRVQRYVTRGLLDRCATDIIACGEGSMDAVWHPRWRSDPRCRVVYDAVDPSRFDPGVDRAAVRRELGIGLDTTLFVHVGYETAEKNHPRLLRIFRAIHARDAGARLMLVGDGTDQPHGVIARELRELRLDPYVVRLGVRADVPRLMAAADALLLPSLREGLPGVVLEACLAGLPALATDLPGVREVAVRLPGVFHLPLSEPDDAWADLALSLPAHARRLDLRRHALERFAPTPFHVARAVDAHRALWRGVRQPA